MSRVRALVEGQTEQAFVKEVLAPNLGIQSVFVLATMIGKPGRRGGVRAWSVVRSDVVATLKQNRMVYGTTMFDYYGLPPDWPGTTQARSATPYTNAANAIEQALLTDVCNELGRSFDPRRFIPYVQMHEFEALLFSGTRVLASVLRQPDLQSRLDEIVAWFVSR